MVLLVHTKKSLNLSIFVRLVVVCVLALVFGGAATAVDAATLVVCPSGTAGQNGCQYIGGEGIQQAVDAASNGDTIELREGTYTNANPRQYGTLGNKAFVLISDKSLTLRGSTSSVINGSSVPAQTCGIVLTGNANMTIESLTVTEMKLGVDNRGGDGLELRDNAQAQIRNSRFNRNDGVGIVMRHSSRLTADGIEANESKKWFGLYMTDTAQSEIRNSRFNSNGQGISLREGSRLTADGIEANESTEFNGLRMGESTQLEIRNSQFIQNKMNGLFVKDNSRVEMRNSLIVENSRGAIDISSGNSSPSVLDHITVHNNTGGGVVIDNSPSIVIKNSIITDSKRMDSGRIGFAIGSHSLAENLNANNIAVSNTLLWNNAGGGYCGSHQICDFPGKIEADPLFVNAAAGDFHLPSNSPACRGGEGGTYMGAFPCLPTTITPHTDGTYPWTNHGPTAAWTSPASKDIAICNRALCWLYNPDLRGWKNEGKPIVLASTWNTPVGGVSLQPIPSSSSYPWTAPYLSAGWEHREGNSVGLAYAHSPYAWDITTGSGGSWQNGGVPLDLSTRTYIWGSIPTHTDGTKPWTTPYGMTAAFTDSSNRIFYTCAGTVCWRLNLDTNMWNGGTNPTTGQPYNSIVDLATAWSSVLAPAPDGTTLFTPNKAQGSAPGPVAAWTDIKNNRLAICNGRWCWNSQFQQGRFISDGLERKDATGKAQPIDICRAWTNNALTDTQCQTQVNQVTNSAPTPPTPTPTPNSLICQACSGSCQWVEQDAVCAAVPLPEGATCHANGTDCVMVQPLEQTCDFCGRTCQWKTEDTVCAAVAPPENAECRVNGSECQQFTVTPENVRGDLNGDGQVNATDLNILVATLYTDKCEYRLYNTSRTDCLITIADFNELISIMR